MTGKKLQKALLRTEEYAPVCAFCLFGKPSPDGASVLCAERGVMRKHSSCKKYAYDPLKRQPPRTPVLPEYDPEQFVL
ncbi:MAG: hypothetical protein LBB50_00020 [Oscillospiraceae bacterium]|jgi:hypothetical protein|nr:hypothetical protein [Oscillospiraceae bacterium]